MTSAPADFRVDVVKASVTNAEQRVYDYLRHRGWDFEVYPHPGILWRLDVKADHWMDESGRLPYETHHEYPDGSEKPGWGRVEALDRVAVVAMGKKGVPGTHRCVLVHRREMHQLVEPAIARATREHRSMPAGWVPFKNYNECGDYVTHGWAVPMDQAFKAMVYRETWELPGGRSDR